MGTRSNICSINDDGTVRVIYTHWDGYPRHHGPLLLTKYNTPEKVNALLDLGDISVLAESIEKPEGHTFDNPVDGYTIAYGRDRGEKGTEARVHKSLESALRSCDNDFTYIFDGRVSKTTGKPKNTWRFRKWTGPIVRLTKKAVAAD